MTTNPFFAVFEDFNEPQPERLPAPEEAAPEPAADIGELCSDAWTEGYITACREDDVQDPEQPLTAKLLTSVYDLDARTSEAVDAASLVVADMLVNTVLAVTAEEWSAQLLDRVKMIADRIKPALTVVPEYVLRDEQGAIQHFGNILDLSRALDAGSVGEDVTIRWQRGEATISRTAFLDDIRDAIIPLSAGRVKEQNARTPT
jgi:hypothetical protein